MVVRRPRGLGRLPYRQILMLVPLALVLWAAVRHWSVLVEGFGHLRRAEWPWLPAAGAATCGTWVAASAARQGALVERLPVRRLPATQFAAGTANHLLPTGLGAGAVSLRFMAVCGVPPARSSAAPARCLPPESIARVGLLTALLIAFPHALQIGSLLPDGALGPLLIGSGVVAAVALPVLLPVRKLRAIVLTCGAARSPSPPYRQPDWSRWGWRWGCRCRPLPRSSPVTLDTMDDASTALTVVPALATLWWCAARRSYGTPTTAAYGEDTGNRGNRPGKRLSCAIRPSDQIRTPVPGTAG